MKGTQAMTATERSREHRKRRTETGWKLIQVFLEPEVADALDRLEAESDDTQAQLVNKAIGGFANNQ